jgi:hypothetical protein
VDPVDLLALLYVEGEVMKTDLVDFERMAGELGLCFADIDRDAAQPRQNVNRQPLPLVDRKPRVTRARRRWQAALAFGFRAKRPRTIHLKRLLNFRRISDLEAAALGFDLPISKVC